MPTNGDDSQMESYGISFRSISSRTCEFCEAFWILPVLCRGVLCPIDVLLMPYSAPTLHSLLYFKFRNKYNTAEKADLLECFLLPCHTSEPAKRNQADFLSDWNEWSFQYKNTSWKAPKSYYDNNEVTNIVVIIISKLWFGMIVQLF